MTCTCDNIPAPAEGLLTKPTAQIVMAETKGRVMPVMFVDGQETKSGCSAWAIGGGNQPTAHASLSRNLE